MVLPPWTPTKTNFNFFDNHCKGKVFAKIFCVERLFPTCLVWVLQPFEWTQLGFLAFAKIVFFPLKRLHRFSQPTSKAAVLSHGRLSSSIRSEVMVVRS